MKVCDRSVICDLDDVSRFTRDAAPRGRGYTSMQCQLNMFVCTHMHSSGLKCGVMCFILTWNVCILAAALAGLLVCPFFSGFLAALEMLFLHL